MQADAVSSHQGPRGAGGNCRWILSPPTNLRRWEAPDLRTGHLNTTPFVWGLTAKRPSAADVMRLPPMVRLSKVTSSTGCSASKPAISEGGVDLPVNATSL